MSIDAFVLPSGATMGATVLIGPEVPLPLPPEVSGAILRVVVDTHSRLPGMFEITFSDPDGMLLTESDLDVGFAVRIIAAADIDDPPLPLITGEVTAIEAICDNLDTRIVVRGYDKANRLQRIRRTRVWEESLDIEIATQIATEAGLLMNPGQMIPTGVPYQYQAQVNQTDWEFLQYRAAEIGYETGIDNEGLFYFRPAPGNPLGDAEEAEEALEGTALLTFKQNLITFLPSVTAANITPMVEVRMWDNQEGIAALADAPAAVGTTDIAEQPEELAAPFVEPEVDLPPLDEAEDASPADLDAQAPPPDPLALVIANRPAGTGVMSELAAEALAQGVSVAVGSTFAEAEGYALGNPAIRPGAPVEIDGVPDQFAGIWTVTNAQHTFDMEEGGYFTRFWVSGAQDRTLLGLISMGDGYGRPPRMPGLACGIVVANNETLAVPPLPPLGRVKFALPWLDPAFVSDWARVVQPGSGPLTGTLFLPQVGDEVLVGFEMGDVRRPYVLGGLINLRTLYNQPESMLGPVVAPTPGSGAVLQRAIVAPSGNRLVFSDLVTDPAVPANPEQSSIYLGNATRTQSVSVNWGATPNEVSLTCDPNMITVTPDAVLINCPDGTVSITGGTVNITGETVSVEATAELNLTAPSISIEAEGDISIDAPEIGLNSP